MNAPGGTPFFEFHDLDSCLENVSDKEPHVMALLPETGRAKRILREFEALKARYPNAAERPPLFGVLLGVKDIFRADGFETRAGSALPAEVFAGPEASLVTRFKELGVLVLGKTVSTEFAFMEPGPTRNPHHLLHTPGGSSSGSAAAVACGYCGIALGSQTIGSISRPAAYCGVVGFKPSFGLLPCDGIVPFSPSADHVGFFTQKVEEARFVASLLLKNSPLPHSATANSARKPVLGVPDGPFLMQAELAAREYFEALLNRFESCGYSVVRVPLFHDIEAINQRHRAMITAELATVHEKWFVDFSHLYKPGTHAAILQGQKVSVQELEDARASQLLLRAEIANAMAKAGVDVWISPSAPNTAPEGLLFTGSPVMNLPWTHAGMPTVSLPSGFSKKGLPFGLQLAAEWGRDLALLDWAVQLQL